MTDYSTELGENNEISEKQVETALLIKSTEGVDKEYIANTDSQLRNAHNYPRDLKNVLKNILFLATQDKDTADSCFYSIKRDGKTIRGASIRLAEIISTCYGNLRVSARVVSNDGKSITAQGMAWDLQNNVAFSVEVKRRITDKYGITFSEDMQVVTANACSSIALRNAIFKVVPEAVTARVQKEIKKVVLGEEKDFEEKRKTAIKYFVDKGVPEKNILLLFDKKTVEDLTPDDIFDLRGIATAIAENDTTIEQAFFIQTKGNSITKATHKLSDIPEQEIIATTDINYDNLKPKEEVTEKLQDRLEENFKTSVKNDSDKDITVTIENSTGLNIIEGKNDSETNTVKAMGDSGETGGSNNLEKKTQKIKFKKNESVKKKNTEENNLFND